MPVVDPGIIINPDDPGGGSYIFSKGRQTISSSNYWQQPAQISSISAAIGTTTVNNKYYYNGSPFTKEFPYYSYGIETYSPTGYTGLKLARKAVGNSAIPWQSTRYLSELKNNGSNLSYSDFVAPGTNPGFGRCLLFSGSGGTKLSIKSTTRTSGGVTSRVLEIYSGWVDDSSTNPTLKWTAYESDFPDGNIPKRLIVILQGPGGHGVDYPGTDIKVGGGSGGFVAGVVSLAQYNPIRFTVGQASSNSYGIETTVSYKYLNSDVYLIKATPGGWATTSGPGAGGSGTFNMSTTQIGGGVIGGDDGPQIILPDEEYTHYYKYIWPIKINDGTSVISSGILQGKDGGVTSSASSSQNQYPATMPKICAYFGVSSVSTSNTGNNASFNKYQTEAQSPTTSAAPSVFADGTYMHFGCGGDGEGKGGDGYIEVWC